MRSLTLAVLGLVALSHALPKREPGTVLSLRADSDHQDPTPLVPNPSPDSPLKDKFWLPDSHKSDKQNIQDAENELEQLQNELKTCDDSEKDSIKDEIKHIKKYLKSEGISSIKSDPGVITTLTPGKRDNIWIPSATQTDQENIAQAEAKLEELENELSGCDDDDRAEQIKDEIRHIYHYLHDTAHITNIQVPPGVISTLTPGKRDNIWIPSATQTDQENIAQAEAKLEELENELSGCDDDHRAEQIKDEISHIYHYLHDTAHITNIQVPPGVISTLTPGKRGVLARSIARRQTMKIGSCDSQQILELMTEYSILQAFFGTNPPAAVQTEMALIQSFLAACGTSVGGIIPSTPTTGGGAVTPAPPNPGAPLNPGK